MYTIVENKFHIVINLSEEEKCNEKFLIKICALLTVSSMLIEWFLCLISQQHTVWLLQTL